MWWYNKGVKYLVAILGLILVIGIILLFIIPTPNKNIEVTSLEIENSVIEVEGKAKGTWFFEGDAPLILIDENENIIAQSYITASSDSMTEDFVPFTGVIEFEERDESGILIFRKDNPSGLSKYDDSLEIKINFNGYK